MTRKAAIEQAAAGNGSGHTTKVPTPQPVKGQCPAAQDGKPTLQLIHIDSRGGTPTPFEVLGT
jgi:hypothetical protein